MEYHYLLASDVERNGLGVEMNSANGTLVAEVFRCDADNSVTVTLFAEALPFAHIEKLVRMARTELGVFEDGTALPGPVA